VLDLRKVGVRNTCITFSGEEMSIERVATNVALDQWAAKLGFFEINITNLKIIKKTRELRQ
jgi:hypothetical protein